MGTGGLVREKREVESFDKISLKGIGKVIIRQGEEESLEVEAREDLLPSIVTEVEDGRLVIGYETDWSSRVIIPTTPIRFRVTMQDVRLLEILGAGSVEAYDVETESLELIIKSAGSIRVKSLSAEALAITISGAGGTKLSGKVDRQEVTINGVGGHQAGRLESGSCTVTVNGAGGATVWARDTLDVTISGVGGVKYYGSPKVTQSISGLGGVKSMGNR